MLVENTAHCARQF